MRIHGLLEDPNAVVISAIPPSDPVQPADYVKAALRLLEALQLELEGENVVIKPNVTAGESFADPDSGIGTHPAFVEGLITYLRQHGVPNGRGHGHSIFILEDPRNSDDNAPRHWRGTGYPEVAATTGAQLRTPSQFTCVRKSVPRPLVHPTLNVSRLVVAPGTVFINVPKMKTHNLGITTLCMKNLMGVVDVFERHYCAQAWLELPEEVRIEPRPRPELLTPQTHERWQEGLARRLADLAQVAKPALNIVEGVIARDGTGFRRGTNYPLGLTIAGSNVVAVDSVASYLMGFDPKSLIYLRIAAEAGLGTNDLTQLRAYLVTDAGIVPCPDLERLRARPPLKVIRNVPGAFDILVP